MFKTTFVIVKDKSLHPEHRNRYITVFVEQTEARGEVFRGTSDNVLVVGIIKTNEVAIGEFSSR